MDHVAAIVDEFLAESDEQLDRLTHDLVALHERRGSADLLRDALRSLHTLKGTSAMLGFAHLAERAHAGESLLGGQGGQPALSEEWLRAGLDLVDGLRALLQGVERSGADHRAAPIQPVGGLWARLPTLVGELARPLGREVELHLAGHRTLLAGPVLRALRAPVVQLVRNAVDHGIRPPAERVRAGKQAAGLLSVRARAEDGQVVVEVRDDGVGIPSAVVGQVFRPGFTTAPGVTGVSGRGMGMDVVRTGVEGVGGRVRLDSRPGIGTTCTIRLPGPG